jgi:hypothetical protein
MIIYLFLKSCISFSLSIAFFPSLFTFSVEEIVSCKKDYLPKSTSFKSKLDHLNLVKAARQHPEAIHCGCP